MDYYFFVVLVGGMGYGLIQEFHTPTPEEIRTRCLDSIKRERAQCRKGMFKTTKRIEVCEEIYEKETNSCG